MGIDIPVMEHVMGSVERGKSRGSGPTARRSGTARWSLPVWLLVLALIAATAVGTGPTAERRPVVLCSTTQIADFARQVAGDDCVVKCILAPGADPHTYMPTPADAKLALEADLCLQNGFHLEGKNWMATLARDAGKPLATCATGVKPIELEVGGQRISDPHAWMSPLNAVIYVGNIVRALCRLDPAHRWQYRARAELYCRQLRVLDGWIRGMVNGIPPARRILVTSHDAFNYFAAAYGFRNLAPVGWSTGAEVGAGMTPERRRQVVSSIAKAGVKAVFVETSVNPKLVREIARDAGVKVGGKLYSDSMGETGSAGETYIGMMRENVLTIVSALE